jgi:hypothetical protein
MARGGGSRQHSKMSAMEGRSDGRPTGLARPRLTRVGCGVCIATPGEVAPNFERPENVK